MFDFITFLSIEVDGMTYKILLFCCWYFLLQSVVIFSILTHVLLLFCWYSEATEMQSEENKLSMEKNKKRRLKTPAQLTALEIFYNGRLTSFVIWVLMHLAE